MPTIIFENRQDAGKRLAQAMEAYAGRSNVVVLALPRGGVPVAAVVADALDAPLDVLVVRKIGVPFQPELAMGAAASGGVTIINDRVVRQLRVTEQDIERATTRAHEEVEQREKSYRAAREAVPLEGRLVIVVDDGIATGATMRAAVAGIRARGADEIVVAVPTAALDSLGKIRREADGVVCLETPDPYYSVGSWYRDFGQTTDEEVTNLLSKRSAKAVPT